VHSRPRAQRLSAECASASCVVLSGKGMHEEGSRVAGKDIVIKDVSAGAFRVLLKFLYAHTLPEEEDCGEGLAVGEMARVADRFQASELYAYCVEQFREGLMVGNDVERLVQAHDSGLAGLEEASMEYFKTNALAFQVICNNLTFIFRLVAVVRHLRSFSFTIFCVVQEQSMVTLNALEQRPDLLHFTLQTTQTLVEAVVDAGVQEKHKAYARGVLAGVAEEKDRAAAALG